jgi:hypothetical protein
LDGLRNYQFGFILAYWVAKHSGRHKQALMRNIKAFELYRKKRQESSCRFFYQKAAAA